MLVIRKIYGILDMSISPSDHNTTTLDLGSRAKL